MSLFFSFLCLFADNQAAEVDTAVFPWAKQVLNGLWRTLVAITVCGRHSVEEGMALVGYVELLIAMSACHEVTWIVSVDRPGVGCIYII